MDFTTSLAQIKPKLGSVADNLALVEELIKQAMKYTRLDSKRSCLDYARDWGK